MYRDITHSLLNWKNRKGRKPLLLDGARQVGKTYSLLHFGKTHFQKFHYLNFEKNEKLIKIFELDLDPKRIVQEIGIQLNSSIDIKNDLIIFDEVQQCPKAITSLKYFEEEMPELVVCAAGSLLGVHLGEGSYPVGKIDCLEMYPLTFKEFLLAIGEKKLYEWMESLRLNHSISEFIHSQLWEKFKLYCVVGGMPDVVQMFIENKDNLFDAFHAVRNTQDNLINTHLADIAKHSGKQNSMHIERVWRNIPSQLALEHDQTSSRYRFNDVIPGVHRYTQIIGVIDWLEKAGLIIKVFITNHASFPLSAYTKENFFKLYFFDIGLLGAISQLAPKTILDYGYGTYQGFFAENFVAQELAAAGCKPLYSWKEATAEIEFVLTLNGLLVPIEIKSGWVTQSKSLSVFNQKYHPKTSVVMSANNLTVVKNNQQYRIPVYLASYLPSLQNQS